MRNILGQILVLVSLMAAPAALAGESDFAWEGTQEESEVGTLTHQGDSTDGSGAAWFYGYRCDSWPVWGPGAYYWIHQNVYVARNNAISACNRGTGMTCNWRCYQI